MPQFGETWIRAAARASKQSELEPTAGALSRGGSGVFSGDQRALRWPPAINTPTGISLMKGSSETERVNGAVISLFALRW